jgi:hypothetical protein
VDGTKSLDAVVDRLLSNREVAVGPGQVLAEGGVARWWHEFKLDSVSALFAGGDICDTDISIKAGLDAGRQL